MKALKHEEVVSWQGLSVLLADNEDTPLGWRYYMSHYDPYKGTMRIGPVEGGSFMEVQAQTILHDAPPAVRHAAASFMECLKKRQDYSRMTLVRHEVIDPEAEDDNVVELFPDDPPTDEDLDGLRMELREVLSSHNINPQTWSSLS